MCAEYGPKRFYAEVIVNVVKTSRVAKHDDFNSKLLFFVKNKGQWNAKSGPKVAAGNVATSNANKIFGTFGVEMRASGRNWSNFAH